MFDCILFSNCINLIILLYFNENFCIFDCNLWYFPGSNLTFGEVALVEQDCIRTATVVANSHLDLLVIDRDLFNRCLHGVVAEDMKVGIWEKMDEEIRKEID